MRRLGAALTGVLIVLAAAAPAWAQYPPNPPTCQVNDTTVTPGQTVQVSGQNWQENSSVDIRFRQGNDDQQYGPFPTDSQGSFSAPITIPADANDGPAQIVVGGDDQNGRRHVCRTQITVDADGGGPPPPGSPICAVDDATPAQGQTVKVSGRQWLPKSTVEIRFVQGATDEHLATAGVNGAGRFSHQARIPEDASNGPAEIRVEGQDRNGSPAVCRVQIVVGGSAQSAGLTVTGAISPGTLALLIGTVGVLYAGRRRRSRGLLPRRA